MAKRRKPKPQVETHVTTINGLTWLTVRTTYDPAVDMLHAQTADGVPVTVARYGVTESVLVNPLPR